MNTAGLQQSLSLLGRQPIPNSHAHAAEVLDTTSNALLLEPAVRLLQNQFNRSLMTGKENVALGELARRYFLKAKALDPDLDDVWVFPKLGGFSSILVFRDNLDAHPEELARSEDKSYLQDVGNDKIEYSRGITAADRKFIMTHYRAYGGPEPPPIDHQGIDDAFLEKASVTYYWYEGKWLRLQGAD